MIKDNYIYYIYLDTTDDTLTITKVHIADTECDMRDTSMASDGVEEEVLVIQNPTSTPINGIQYISCKVLANSVVFSINDYNNHRHIVFTLPSNMSSLTSYVEVTQAATSLTFTGMSFLNSDATKLIVGANTDKLYTVALNNLANVTEISNDGATIGNNVPYETGKRHYLTSAVYDETLNKLYPTNTGANAEYFKTVAPYKSDSSAYCRTDANSRAFSGRRNDYLATINNLSSAVTKDTTQTMKVIYTLTFAS